MTLSDGKVQRLKALANSDGVIAAAAIDQRGTLETMMAAAGDGSLPDAAKMSEFKSAVVRVLSPYTSAMLIDTDFGLPAVPQRAPGCGLLLTYERFGYDPNVPGRIPELLEHLSVRRMVEMGAQGIKILLHYTPFEDPEINDRKHAWVERIGAECESNQVPFFLEFVGYDPSGGDMNTVEYARLKPEIVTGSMHEFSRPQYHADVLKVEFPVNVKFIEGCRSYRGQAAYSRQQALDCFRTASQAALKPFIFLSAGVSNPEFCEALQLAAEADSDFSGVLCGRATWQEGVPVYVREGLEALEQWLATEGIRNIRAVNERLRVAKPWWTKMSVASR